MKKLLVLLGMMCCLSVSAYSNSVNLTLSRDETMFKSFIKLSEFYNYFGEQDNNFRQTNAQNIAINVKRPFLTNTNSICMTNVVFIVTNSSGNNLSITFQRTDVQSQFNFSDVVSPGSNKTFSVPTGIYNVIISPASNPYNCNMSFNTGESYGPAPGHTFSNINIASDHTTSLSVTN